MPMNPFSRKLGFLGGRQGRAPSEIADEIIEFLKTGEMRESEEVAKTVRAREEKVERILDFLAEAGLIRKSFQITKLGAEVSKLPKE